MINRILIPFRNALHSTMYLLISSSAASNFCRNPTLHSTMYLLICYNVLYYRPKTESFTFHYVSINMALWQATHNCFCDFTFHYVSINMHSGTGMTVYVSDFTFHYVSINIIVRFGIFLFEFVFTFHYVSINIEMTDFFPQNFRTLHSTMYLLICVSASTSCILLLNFTFHYVSINISNEQTS